jgi:hypothetical protein
MHTLLAVLSDARLQGRAEGPAGVTPRHPIFEKSFGCNFFTDSRNLANNEPSLDEKRLTRPTESGRIRLA